MSRSDKNGSAEAATSPSHGSNNPDEETAVNKRHDTTMSGDGASEPIATPEELATMDFEPWKGDPTADFIHTQQEWADLGELHLPTASMAYVLMFKTKAQMIEIEKNAPGELLTLLDQVGEMRDRICGYVGLLDNAEARILIALSSHSVAQLHESQKSEAS